jgi:hypothetical protein
VRARVFDPASQPLEQVYGSVLAADVPGADGHDALRKGLRLGATHAAALSALRKPIHVVDLDPGELEQDAVASRLAAAVAGPGSTIDPPSQGQSRVRAAVRGRVRVRNEAVAAVNRLHPLLLFTAADGRIVAEGDDIAGAKSATLATDEALVVEAELIARSAPVLAVTAFARRRVGVVVTDRLEPQGRALVRDAIQRKIEWFGSQMTSFSDVAHETAAVTKTLTGVLAGGAELILMSGGSPLDPLDPVLHAIQSSGGRVERTGVPAHPGSMVWVGAIGTTPVLGIATCAGFGKDTALDLLLARVLAGDAPTEAADALGAGGLAEGAAPGSPFPPYPRAKAAR